MIHKVNLGTTNVTIGTTHHKVNPRTTNVMTETTHHSKGKKVYLYPHINNPKCRYGEERKTTTKIPRTHKPSIIRMGWLKNI